MYAAKWIIQPLITTAGKLQELLELAQRKFLRQVIQYADAMESSPFPRLFVLDFLSDKEMESMKATDQEAGELANEPAHQCQLAAAEAANDAAEAANTTCAEVVLIFLLLILKCEIIVLECELLIILPKFATFRPRCVH